MISTGYFESCRQEKKGENKEACHIPFQKNRADNGNELKLINSIPCIEVSEKSEEVRNKKQLTESKKKLEIYFE